MSFLRDLASRRGPRESSADGALLGELVQAFRTHATLTQDILSSNGALIDVLQGAEQRAGAQGFAQVSQRLVHASKALHEHNARLLEVIDTTASALDSFASSIDSFESRFRELERFIGVTQDRASDIVKLAFQSKILALNARIEAARLGEEGAGFNVVAEEMGTQAEQTESLSTDITANLSDMTGALLATSQEFERNKASFGVAEKTVHALRTSLASLGEETASVVAASDEMEQLAFNQVELQEEVEAIGRHAGWVREAAEGLLAEVSTSGERTLEAWRQQLPAGQAHFPDSLEAFETQLLEAVTWHDPKAAATAVRDALGQGLAAEVLLDRLGVVAMRANAAEGGRELPTESYLQIGDVLQQALTRLEPALARSASPEDQGVVVLGNAFEDYHNLGRRLVAISLQCAGFRVVDLGLSVSNDRFVAAAREHGAHVIGVSSLLLHTAKWIPKLREQLRREGLGHVAVIAGGAPFLVDPELRDRFGVDGVGRSPADAVRLVRALVAQGNGGVDA